MLTSRTLPIRRWATACLGLAIAATMLATAAKSQAASAESLAQIDTECNAIQNAVMAMHPIHVAYRSGTWVVLSDADAAAAEQVSGTILLADAYKQGQKYAWVQAHTFDSNGKQRATQLCFRQSDGTLERARQAVAVPDLAAAGAEQAYYSSDGQVIQKTALFEVNDPLVAKKIEALPFYSVLPQ